MEKSALDAVSGPLRYLLFDSLRHGPHYQATKEKSGKDAARQQMIATAESLARKYGVKELRSWVEQDRKKNNRPPASQVLSRMGTK